MPELKLTKNHDDFKKSFALSFALHGAILSLFLVKFLFFSEPLIDFSQAINISVGELADSQKLPQKESFQEDKELPPKIEKAANEHKEVAQTEVEVRPEPKQLKKAEITKKKDLLKTDAIDLKKTKSRQDAAFKKLKKTSAIEKIKQDLKKDSFDKLRAQLRSSAGVSRGSRIVPAGTALAGLDKLQAGNYLQVVDQNVKSFWALPQWLINKPYKARLLLKIDPQGKILSLKVTSPSGNSNYDNYCMQAVEKAAPFPEVPEKLSEKFKVDGIVIGFPE